MEDINIDFNFDDITLDLDFSFLDFNFDDIDFNIDLDFNDLDFI